MACPSSIPNVYLKRPVYYMAVDHLAVLSVPKLVQSNSCPGASSLLRIIPNRDPADLQSFSISRLPADVDGRLHVQHRHVDADRRPGLAGPEAFQLAVSAWP